MTGSAIYARMIRRGIRQKDIAATCGKSPSAVNNVIHGRRRSQRIEETIARELGVPRERLFTPKARRYRRAA